MSKKKGTKKRGSGRYTPIKRLKMKGSKLHSSLSEMNIVPVEWVRNLLPEHLWIASLADIYSFETCHKQYDEFMDLIDLYIPDGNYAYGFISDFGLVPVDKREEFKEKYRDSIVSIFHRPIGRILSFYPDNPAYWLIDDDQINKEGSLDPEVELSRLRNLVIKLYPGKDLYAGHLRAIPLGRAFKHGRIHLMRDMEIVNLLPKYAKNCTEEEKYRVQQFARIFMNMEFGQEKQYKTFSWSKYFWRHNFELTICKPRNFYIMGSKPVIEDDLPPLLEVINHNVNIAREYITNIWKKVQFDLYDTNKNDVIFGLISRLIRLYCLLLEDPNLWSRDISGIILRCLVDCAITYSYLVQFGTEEEFTKFIEYGEGQEKLLMLHLQDNYSGETTMEGLEVEDIAQEHGGFGIEMLDIELGNWTDKTARQLAERTGLQRFYRLVYTPTSSDLHGTWLSLKNTSFRICNEPLHKFHRLPSYREPPAYINTLQLAQEIVFHCVQLSINKLNFPELTNQFQDILSQSGLDSDDKEA